MSVREFTQYEHASWKWRIACDTDFTFGSYEVPVDISTKDVNEEKISQYPWLFLAKDLGRAKFLTPLLVLSQDCKATKDIIRADRSFVTPHLVVKERGQFEEMNGFCKFATVFFIGVYKHKTPITVKKTISSCSSLTSDIIQRLLEKLQRQCVFPVRWMQNPEEEGAQYGKKAISKNDRFLLLIFE